MATLYPMAEPRRDRDRDIGGEADEDGRLGEAIRSASSGQAEIHPKQSPGKSGESEQAANHRPIFAHLSL